MDIDEALQILHAFEREGVEYKVIGAVAMNLHGIVRATEDLDVFILPTPDNIERLRRALKTVYDDPHIDEILAEDLAGEYPAVRYYPPTGEMYVDLMARLGEFTRYEEVEATELVVKGVRLKVATPRELYRLKKDTVRLKDRWDAEMLRQRFPVDEPDRGI